MALSAHAQTLEQRLDAEQYLRGLQDLRVPEILEHYLKSHPAADDIGIALQEIAQARSSLAAQMTASERRAIVDRIIARRRALIQAHPDDPRRAVWHADQAADAFFELWPLEAEGPAAIFGLPDALRRERASSVAAMIEESARRAQNTVDDAIRTLESAPAFARDLTLQQRRRHLAEVERDRRIPFLLGIGAILNAELNAGDATQQRAAMESGAAALQSIVDDLAGPPALQARLHLALAWARLGRFDDAEALCAAAAGDPTATPPDVFAARMTGVINRAANRGVLAALEGLESIEQKYLDPEMVFYRVLIADRRFLLRLDAVTDVPAEQRPHAFVDAFDAYAALMSAEYPPGTVSRDALRAIVFDRMVTAAARTADTPIERMPPIAAMAQADAWTRDATSRERGIVLLESLLQRSDLTGPDRAAALFVLGRALVDHGQPVFAARRFLELARDHPTDASAERAIELAAALSWDEHRRAPKDPETAELLSQTLSTLFERYPNLRSTHRWRYAAGRLALEERRFDEAQIHFAAVTPDAVEWLDANFMQAATARERAIAAAGESDGAPGLHAATIESIHRVRPLIDAGLSSADAHRQASLQYYIGMLRVYEAEATLAAGNPQAALDRLVGIERESHVPREVVGEAMKVRINAYQALRPPRPEEALRDLQRFVENSPGEVGEVLQPMVQSLAGDVERLIDAGLYDQARELATRTLMPAAGTLESWLASPESSGAENTDSLRRLVANAHLLNEGHDLALGMYERLLVNAPDDAELLLGKAECLFALGGEQRLADAMLIYKRLAAAGASIGRKVYWLSQLRMLEALDRTGRHTQQILPRIERLRQSDPEFGGERYRRGFEALRVKYAGRS